MAYGLSTGIPQVLRCAQGVAEPGQAVPVLTRSLCSPIISMPSIGLTYLSRYHAHLARTLEKWSAKVAAVAPSALLPASRKRFSLIGSTKETVKSVGTHI